MRGSTYLVLALLVLPSLSHADPGVFRGPYLNQVSTDGVTILWETPSPSIGTVHYGVNSVSELSAVSNTSSIHHEVRLSGLDVLASPGSRFVYELEVAGTRYPGEFHTAPSGNMPFAFIAYGDNRSSVAQHQAVVDALLAEMEDVRFTVSTGDMVSDGASEADWDSFFTVEAPFLAKRPSSLAIGNHETSSSGDWSLGERIWAHPDEIPPLSNSEAFYHFMYGNAEIIVLNVEADSLYTGLLRLLGGDQEDWLDEVLANPPAGAEHRFVFLHQGPYSSKPGRNGNFWLRQWLPDFKTHNIDLVISGHDHYAEWGWSKVGIPYIIHGGGGAPLYENKGVRVEGDHTINYGESQLGYVLIRVDGPKVEVELKALDGSVVASLGYGDALAPECSVATDCGPTPTYGCPGGEWECHRSACRFTCENTMSSLITCITDNACDSAIGAQCPGTPRCERPGINPLEYYCVCDVPPECMSDPDCAGRAPPIEGCVGTWACQDDVCEFTPDTLCEIPAPSDAGVDVDAADAAVDAGDAAVAIDSGSSEDASLPPADSGAEPPSNTDAGATDRGVDAGDLGPEPDGGCGCQTTSAPPGAAWLGLMIGVFVVRRRRPRARRA